jgi:hypothetical protein
MQTVVTHVLNFRKLSGKLEIELARTVSTHYNLDAGFELKTYATPPSTPALQIRGEIALFRQMLGVTVQAPFELPPQKCGRPYMPLDGVRRVNEQIRSISQGDPRQIRRLGTSVDDRSFRAHR